MIIQGLSKTTQGKTTQGKNIQGRITQGMTPQAKITQSMYTHSKIPLCNISKSNHTKGWVRINKERVQTNKILKTIES